MSDAELERLKAELTATQEALRASERNLERAQQLGTFGVLACGLVHDFNNLLAVIGGMTSMALEDASEGPLTVSLEQIRLATQRAAELAAHLLRAAGTATPHRSLVCLNEVLVEVRLLIQAAVPGAATLVYEFAENLPLVSADVTQLRQVVLNLLLNAAEALEEEGVVSVTTGVVAAGVEGAPRSTAGGWVTLEVTDSGCGMGDETHDKIFEPFFSKKSSGRGLGMGVVKQILAAHGGSIEIESAKGEGTTVRILLPHSSKSVDESVEDDTTRGWTLPTGKA